MFFKQLYIWNKVIKVIYITISIIALIAVFSTLYSKSVLACTDCESAIDDADPDIWEEAEGEFDEKIDHEFVRVEKFIIHEMWEQSILGPMMLAAEQFTAVALQQAMAIGMFIDAESQMDAQRLLQELRAKTHKDYQPSTGMCAFGSIMKSLAATERRGEVTSVILAQRSQDKQLGLRDSAGLYGRDLDHEPRIYQFKTLFCSEKDRNSVLSTICNNQSWSNASNNADDKRRMNKDIDYFSLIDSPWNLSLDFTNQELLKTSSPVIYNEDEEHVFAMTGNLFAHNNFPRIAGKHLEYHPEKELTSMQKAYMDMRSIIAKRSVAENSFYAIAAMKARGNKSSSLSGSEVMCVGENEGTGACPATSNSAAEGSGSSGVLTSVTYGEKDGAPNSLIYMEHILKELGVPKEDTLRLLGDHPSYYAQMEIITKKLYQNPDFYTNLYDKPANIERKTVSLQAIKLMQKFDMLKSFLRNEATSSILLELSIANLQGEIEDRIQDIKVGKKK